MSCGGPRQFGRRDVLVLGAGAVALGFVQGCAILRGGAQHPRYEAASARLQDGRLFIPMEDLEGVRGGGVLEVHPGQSFPTLLVTQPDAEVESFRVVTAKCPHRDCTVDWSKSQGGWWCPCHGSRFSPEGAVLEGPAKKALQSPAAELVAHGAGRALAIDLSTLRAG